MPVTVPDPFTVTATYTTEVFFLAIASVRPSVFAADTDTTATKSAATSMNVVQKL